LQERIKAGKKRWLTITNYLIRDMLYPVDDFRELNQRDISKTARLLNERPRKILDFRTPYEVFSKLR
jgi:IS30 family transposase